MLRWFRLIGRKSEVTSANLMSSGCNHRIPGVRVEILQGINLGVRFIVELAALFALGWWGFHYGKTARGKYGLAMLAPLTGAGVWGFFIAPNAPVDVGPVLRFLLQIVVFGAAVLCLVAIGERRWAVILGSVVIVNGALLVILSL